MIKVDFQAGPGAASDARYVFDRAFQSWDGLVDLLPVGVFACDRDGRIIRYNAAAAEIWGRKPDLLVAPVRYCGSFQAYRADGVSISGNGSLMAEALRSVQPIRGREMIMERPDGTRVHVIANVDLLFNDEGVLAGGVGCLQDISTQKRAQARVEERERWYVDLLQSLPAAIYTTDAEGRVTFYNEAAVELAGRRPEIGVDEWCVTWKLRTVDGAPLPHDSCPMAAALKENRSIRGIEAIAERPDGTTVPFLPYPTPLRDEAGEVIGAVNMLVDISELKRGEERQTLMMNELNHRVKNSLAIVQAISSHTFRSAASPEAFKRSFEDRLIALSRAHDLLSRATWRDLELAELLDLELTPHRGEGADRAALNGPVVKLEASQALVLAMVFHELATNAAKYGALSVPAGRVNVNWAVDDANVLRLKWREAGGPTVVPAMTMGFGLKLIRRSVESQLGGELQYDLKPEGLDCTLRIPFHTF